MPSSKNTAERKGAGGSWRRAARLRHLRLLIGFGSVTTAAFASAPEAGLRPTPHPGLPASTRGAAPAPKAPGQSAPLEPAAAPAATGAPQVARTPSPSSSNSDADASSSADSNAQRSDAWRPRILLRGSLGGGVGFDTIASEPLPLVFDNGDVTTGSIRGTLLGSVVAINIFAGASVAPGVVFGLAIQNHLGQASSSGEVEAGNVIARESLQTDSWRSTFAAPAFDYYLLPWRGLHLQGAIGLLLLDMNEISWEQSGQVATKHEGSGWGFSVGAGYDWAMSEVVSAGLLANILYGSTSGRTDSDQRWSDRVFLPTIALSVVLH